MQDAEDTASAAGQQRPAPRRTPTEPVDHTDFQLAARVNTAPSRNALLRTNSSFLQSLRFDRQRSVANVNEDPRQPYSYTFDPLSEPETSDDEQHEEAGAAATQTDTNSSTRPGVARKETFQKKPSGNPNSYSRFNVDGNHVKTKGHISRRDGRLNISINETASGYVAKALGQRIKHHLDIPARLHQDTHPRYKASKKKQTAQDREHDEAIKFAASLRKTQRRPRLNICIQVIGSRGDIQPFIRIGKILQEAYGHRVRIASHPTFRDFVGEAGLEFFSVGGDPSELMAFMVKNPGLIPNLETIREGEVQRRRAAMAVMFKGFWNASINSTDDEKDMENLRMMGDKAPFVADAIIANPPSMAHVHIAERLGIPLHMMFTFPYSPTQQFPHPLANIMPHKSNVDANYVNFMSYPLVEMMTWQGLGDIVNDFRLDTLGLEPVSSLWAPGALYRMHVPYTYLWSPGLCTKPKDWGPEIDVAGFVFLDLAEKFKPSRELQDFLDAGDPPIYIGFGSIVLDDPDAFTDLIFEAVKTVTENGKPIRILLNKGWAGMGLSNSNTPDNIFMLGNTPHDWLFPRCRAVVHHGGAGTTAIGLKCAKPTMIIPFFGDQPFWGAMVAEAQQISHGCIPYKRLTAEKLAEGIRQCLTEDAQRNVQKIADSIASEGDGAENAVMSFHRSLPLSGRGSMRCSILEDRPGVWQMRGSSMRLSALAAEILVRQKKIKWSDLKLRRHYEWNDFDGPGEPVTGSIEAVKDSFLEIGAGAGMVPVRIARHIHKHEEHEQKRRERAAKRDERVRAKEAKKNDQSAGPDLSRQQTNMTGASVPSSVASIPIRKRVVGEFESGIERAGWALITLPNNLHVAIARGFHNAPRLYGDATVRKPLRITGFKSGTRAAGQEFAYGLWDGATGVVLQPFYGWKEGGTIGYKFMGLGSGVAKGVGGLVLKSVNAFVAPPAYFGKGVFKYVEKKMHGPGTKEYIRKAEIVQGQRDYEALRVQSETNGKPLLGNVRREVLEAWEVVEQIWQLAGRQIGSVSGGVNRFRFAREKRRWHMAGALESVATAKLALEAHKQGRDVAKLFAERRRELDEAEAHRRKGVMEVPESPAEEKSKLIGDGRTGTFASRKIEKDKVRRAGPEEEKPQGSRQASDSTLTPEQEPGRQGSVPASTMPNKGQVIRGA